MANHCNCGEIHSHEVELGVQYNLYGKIDKNGAECLNEFIEGSGISVFKPWEDRLNCDKVEQKKIIFNLLRNYQLIISNFFLNFFFSLLRVMRMKSYFSTYRTYYFSSHPK